MAESLLMKPSGDGFAFVCELKRKKVSAFRAVSLHGKDKYLGVFDTAAEAARAEAEAKQKAEAEARKAAEASARGAPAGAGPVWLVPRHLRHPNSKHLYQNHLFQLRCGI